MNIDGEKYTAAEIHERIGNISQIGGTRHLVLNEGASKGVSAIEVNTIAGLSYTVLADRGMDISRAYYKGICLAHLTGNGEAHPAYYDPHGSGWLRNFFGGLLTTCGLTYMGPPGPDGNESLGLHGRYSNLPAKKVQDMSEWEGDDYRIQLKGTVEECVIFGDKLRLTRTITSMIDNRSITIQDTIENFGFKTSPFTILYHINPGFPLLDETSQLYVSSETTEPRDDEAAKGISEWNRFRKPQQGYSEQVFFHKMKKREGSALLVNRGILQGIALEVRFDTTVLPYLAQWKMMGQGDYVLGIEPCNVPVLHRSVLRDKGLLPLLQPREVQKIKVEMYIHEGKEEIDHAIRRLSS